MDDSVSECGIPVLTEGSARHAPGRSRYFLASEAVSTRIHPALIREPPEN